MTRPIRIEGDIAYVPLTKGYEAIIDVADVPLVEGHNWYAQVGSTSVYAIRKEAVSGHLKTIRMHRVLLGAEGATEIDHRDRNGLNNRRSNLRWATRSQNNCNQVRAKSSTSGLKGVTRDPKRNQWRSQIKINGKTRTLGRFSSAEDAHAAYVAASAELHGEFGRTS